MSSVNEVREKCKKDMDNFLRRGGIPVIEYRLPDDEWLVVNIEIIDRGVLFILDHHISNDDLWFSGSILQDGNEFIMPYDDHMEDLDSYLQEIDREIIEGYLIPNNLYI